MQCSDLPEDVILVICLGRHSAFFEVKAKKVIDYGLEWLGYLLTGQGLN